MYVIFLGPTCSWILSFHARGPILVINFDRHSIGILYPSAEIAQKQWVNLQAKVVTTPFISFNELIDWLESLNKKVKMINSYHEEDYEKYIKEKDE